MNFCRAEIYVGTPLQAKLAREGRLRGDAFGWDYAIREPAAERAFRIFARAFLDRNFRCDGLMNSALGLGYHLHLLRTFYPKVAAGSLGERVRATTHRVNVDCVDRMEDILAFADSKRGADPAALEDFTAKVTGEVQRASASLEQQVSELTREIVDAALSPPRTAKPAPTSAKRSTGARARWGMLSVAGLTLAPLSAVDCKSSPPRPIPCRPPLW